MSFAFDENDMPIDYACNSMMPRHFCMKKFYVFVCAVLISLCGIPVQGADYKSIFMEEYATLIEPSAKENGLLWDDDTSIPEFKSVSSWEFRNNFNTLKSWLDTRVKYMLDHKNFGLYE